MPFDESRPYDFDRVVRIFISCLILYGLYWLLTTLQDALTPFVIALLLAYLFNPVVHVFERRLKIKKRGTAVLTSLSVVLILFSLASWLILPTVSHQVTKMVDLLSVYANEAEVQQYLPQNLQDKLLEFAQSEEARQFFTQENLTEVAKRVIPGFWNFFSGSLSFVFNVMSFFIILIYLIFILIDYDDFAGKWDDLIPPKYRSRVVKVVQDVEKAMNTYFRAQALIAALVGVLFAIGFSIIGLPLAILFGLFVGLLNMVPYLQTVSLVPAFFLALLQSLENDQDLWVCLGLVAIVYVVVQSIQELFLIPKIMGDATGLNPAMIILSLSVWGSLLGVLGMMIALPMTTLISAYYSEFMSKLDQKHEAG